MNKLLFIILLLIVSIPLYSQDSQKINDLEKRIENLEKKNNDLEIELEETKRSILDNSNDASSDINKIALQKVQWGKEFAFEFSGGLQGIYSQINIGILFPKIKNTLILGIGLKITASIIPMIYFDKSKDDINSNYYSIYSIYFKFGGTSPLFFNFMRVYGYGEFVIGARIQNNDFNVNKNGITVSTGGFGFGGIEFYTSRWSAIFIEAGGGYIGFFTIEKNDADELKTIKINSESGSNGFAFNIGIKVFLAKKKPKTGD